MAKKSKKIEPELRARLQDEYDNIRLIIAKGKISGKETMYGKSLYSYKSDLEQILEFPDGSRESVIAFDVVDIDDLEARTTKVVERYREVINSDGLEAVTRLPEEDVKELLARGIPPKKVEEIAIKVNEGSEALAPQEIKSAIIATAEQEHIIEPLPEETESILGDYAPEMEVMPEMDSSRRPTTAEERLEAVEDATGFIVEEDEKGLSVVQTRDLAEISSGELILDEEYIERLESELALSIEQYKILPVDTTQLEAQLRADLDSKLTIAKIEVDEEQKERIVYRAIARSEQEKGAMQAEEAEQDGEKEPETGEAREEDGSFTLDDFTVEKLEKELADIASKYRKDGDTEELDKKLREALEERLKGTDLEITEDKKGQIVKGAMTRESEERTETAEEKERREIAESIGEKSEDVLGIIRLSSVEKGEQLMNTRFNARVPNANVIVRLKNNNYKLLEEVSEKDSDGTAVETPVGAKKYKVLRGYEINPVAREIASTLKDTSHSGVTDIQARDVSSGKTVEGSNKYNVYRILRPGENANDNEEYYVQVSSTGRVTRDEVRTHEGGIDFDYEGAETVYTNEITMDGRESEIHDKGEAESHDKPLETKEPSQAVIEATRAEEARLAQRKELLRQAMELDDRIAELEARVPEDPEEADRIRIEMNNTESKRDSILKELGYTEHELAKAEQQMREDEENAEYMEAYSRRRSRG